VSAGGGTLRVAILAFDDVEALDLAGPYEVFTTAARMHQRSAAGTAPPFEVQCVARTRAPVRMRAGLQVLPDRSFDDAMACAATREWIARASREARITASVCTGAFLLAASGVLQGGESVTTHWEDIDDLRSRFPALDVREGVRWVEQGRIVTSAGITAGIDMSLHLVARLAGEPLALRTARQMDFAWTRV
jgi:transcriptional regulator GlxA family with amidase domain